MRRFRWTGVALLLAASGLWAQAPVSVADSTRAELALLARDGRAVPAVGEVRSGDQTVPAGALVPGTVAVRHGTLHVRGILDGSAIALLGDVVVHPGGEVRGDALAVGGRVRADGGRIAGATEVVEGALYVRAAPATPPGLPLRGTLAWLAVGLVVLLAVMVAANRQVETVAEVLARDVSRALGAGLLTQMALLPVLALLVLGLALSVLGLLLIPFAVVAYVLAVAGLLTLGLAAAMLVVGRGVTRRRGASRAAQLSQVLVGFALLAAPLAAVALLAPPGPVTLIARLLVAALLWVTATLGLGAAVLARAGSRRTLTVTAVAPVGWQTPTPVAGVVAARRPTATPSPSVGR